MRTSIAAIKNLHTVTPTTQQTKVEALITKLSQKLKEKDGNLNCDDLTKEISDAAGQLKGHERTEYLENAFSMVDAIEPFKVNSSCHKVLKNIKSLLPKQYFSPNNQINFTKDVQQNIEKLVQSSLQNFSQDLHKIHLNSNNFFKSSAEKIINLKNKMAIILNEEKQHKLQVKETLVSAVILKNMTEITENNWIKIMDPVNRTFRLEDKRFLTSCFPELTTLAAYKSKINGLLENPQSLNNQEYSSLINYFVKTKGSHIDKLWLDLTCKTLQLDSSLIEFSQSHFYIKHQLPSYIPDDGDCAFHCIQYLLEIKALKPHTRKFDL
jgi:hypothetical protein